MAIERKSHRTLARARALRDFTERRVISERGGDMARLESAQTEALQAFLKPWPEDEKLLFIKMYVEEVLRLEHRVLQRTARQSRAMDWLIGGLLVLLALLLILSRK